LGPYYCTLTALLATTSVPKTPHHYNFNSWSPLNCIADEGIYDLRGTTDSVNDKSQFEQLKFNQPTGMISILFCDIYAMLTNR